MENFYLDDNFCMDICDLMTHLDIEEEDVKDLPEGWSVDVEESSLEKIFTLTEKQIVGAIDDIVENQFEERFPEEADSTFEKIIKAVKEGIDIEKINAALPELYYPNGTMSKITKQDLLDYIN